MNSSMVEVEKEVSSVQLLTYQEPNVARIIDIFTHRKHAIDTSPLGAGKMYMATSISRQLGFKHVVVVSPKSTLPKWQTMKEMFGLPVAEGHFMTYAALRGSNKNGPIKKHGLLNAKTISVKKSAENEDDVAPPTRPTGFYPNSEWEDNANWADGEKEEEEEDEEITVRIFEASDRLKKMAEEGCILILDEFQHIKNTSSQQKAATELINCLNDFDDKSKTLLLSGSPVDKATQIITLYRTLGIAKKPALYAKNRYLARILWRRGAFYEVLMYHAALDPATTIQVIEDYAEEEGRLPYDFVDAMIRDIERVRPNGEAQKDWFDTDETEATVTNMSTELFHQLMYRLFLHVTKRFHVSYCNDPKETGEHNTVELKRYNAFYAIQGEDAEKLANAIDDLSRVVSFDDKDNSVSFGGGDGGTFLLHKLTKALMEIESAKIGKICEVIKKYRRDHPTHKVCICVNYKDSITRLCEEFATERPLVIHGGSSLLVRSNAIKSFADDSPRSPALLIGNTQVLCTGIDLDDKVGNRPRFCIVSPNYSGITLYQLSHRFHRQDSKSDATVHMMYSKGKTFEVRILDALSRKGSVMKGITQEQQNVLKYPCDYENVIMDEEEEEEEEEERPLPAKSSDDKRSWAAIMSSEDEKEEQKNVADVITDALGTLSLKSQTDLQHPQRVTA